MTERTHEERDEIVAQLVGEALQRRDETGGVELAELCSEHPELIDEVRHALEVASKLPAMQNAGVGGDRAIGSIFADRYRIDERIGAGAMGVVYGATDLDLGRPVALKVLHLGLLDAEQAMARFDREAAALAAVEHEAVVTIHDRGTTKDGAQFLVMERIDGVSLAHVLDEARSISDLRDDTDWLTERLGIEGLAEPSYLRQAVRWSASLASGLAAAHRAGVYHRDVKPSNVMIRRDGRAVLLDFGIAAKDDQATLTRTDAAVGTPAYMAPEALSGRTKARPSQDVYGLTATLYHLLTLRAPYEGSPSEVLTALALREPVPAFRVRPGLPRDAQAIMDAGLARRPQDRYPSADALENDLRSFLAYRPVSVRPVSTASRAWRRLRRSRAFQGASAVALVVGGYVGLTEIRNADLQARERTHDEAITHIPANFAIVEASMRELSNEADRAMVAEVLDTLVAARHEVVVPRVLRACFRLDHGDARGAAEDMDALAAHLGTPLALELAARYAALPDDAKGSAALDLTDLPDASKPLDHYLVSMHAFRERRFGDAVAAIQQDGLEEYRHPFELRLTTLVAPLMNRSLEERTLPASRAYEAIRDAERRFGGPSAMTSHWAGVALLLQEKNAESLEASRAAVALAPTSHVSWNNIADRAWYVGLLDEAVAACERLFDLQPAYDKAYVTYAKIAIDRNDHDAAVATLVAAPFPSTVAGEDRRQSLLGLVEADRALALYVDGGTDDATNHARIALDHLGSISSRKDVDDAYMQICRRIVDDDLEALLRLLFERQHEDPLLHGRLRTLLDLLSEEIDEDVDGPLAVQMLDLLEAFQRALSLRARIRAEIR